MHLHYIDDSHADLQIVERICRQDPSLVLTTGGSIDDLPQRILSGPIDCLLIDVHRPEAVSLESDVARIRGHSEAPILFVTGGDSDELRGRARSVGAEAVVDKRALSPELLQQVYFNANARLFGVASEAEEIEEDAREADLQNYNLQRLATPLTFVEQGLSTLVEVMLDNKRDKTATYVLHLLETVKSMRHYAMSDLRETSLAPLHALVGRRHAYLRDLARALRINLLMLLENAWFHQIGAPELGEMGVQNLVEGVLRSMRPEGSISVTVVDDAADGTCLDLLLSQKVYASASEMFSLNEGTHAIGLGAAASLNLGLMLLHLSPSQVHVDDMGAGQRVRLYL